MFYLCYRRSGHGSSFETAPDLDTVKTRMLWLQASLGIDPGTMRVFDEADAVDPNAADPSVCPVCGKPIDQDDIDVNDNEEDGYGDMTVSHACPHCGTALIARYDAQNGYAFVGFETD